MKIVRMARDGKRGWRYDGMGHIVVTGTGADRFMRALGRLEGKESCRFGSQDETTVTILDSVTGHRQLPDHEIARSLREMAGWLWDAAGSKDRILSSNLAVAFQAQPGDAENGQHFRELCLLMQRLSPGKVTRYMTELATEAGNRVRAELGDVQIAEVLHVMADPNMPVMRGALLDPITERVIRARMLETFGYELRKDLTLFDLTRVISGFRKAAALEESVRHAMGLKLRNALRSTASPFPCIGHFIPQTPATGSRVDPLAGAGGSGDARVADVDLRGSRTAYVGGSPDSFAERYAELGRLPGAGDPGSAM